MEFILCIKMFHLAIYDIVYFQYFSAISMSSNAYVDLFIDLDPRRHISIDRNKAKLTLVLIHDTTRDFCTFRLIDNNSANLESNVLHSLPMLPLLVNTNGVKLPCSTSRTL